jgi:hypothetical protein
MNPGRSQFTLQYNHEHNASILWPANHNTTKLLMSPLVSKSEGYRCSVLDGHGSGLHDDDVDAIHADVVWGTWGAVSSDPAPRNAQRPRACRATGTPSSAVHLLHARSRETGGGGSDLICALFISGLALIVAQSARFLWLPPQKQLAAASAGRDPYVDHAHADGAPETAHYRRRARG